MSADRATAEARMVAAKMAMTRAARAALDGLPLAAAMTAAALAELEQARRQLNRPDETGASSSWRP